MKSLAIALFVALATLGLTTGAHAQAPRPADDTVSTPAAEPPRPVDDLRRDRAVSPAPGDVNRNDDVGRNDDVSALPRAAAGERTTIFGLTPTSAIILAAALLIVVILAIVAMTRSDDTYFEP